MIQDTILIEKRHQRFIRTVCREGVVYGLKNEEGYASSRSIHYENDDGEEVGLICFWAERALAKSCIKGPWIDYRVDELSLSDFIEDWCIGMDNDNLLVGTEFDRNMFGYEAEPLPLALEIINELIAQHKEIALRKFNDIRDFKNQILDVLNLSYVDHQNIKESVAAFIRLGKFSNINFGDEYTAIVQSLGKPECIHLRSRKDKRPSIIKYGIVEFYFDPSIRGQTLIGILFQPLLHPCPSNKMKLDTGAFGEPMNANELEKYLEEKRIEYSWNKDTLDQRTIKTKSEVVFHFVEENDELVLQKFGKFNY